MQENPELMFTPEGQQMALDRVRARVNTMLMAGIGYDIITFLLLPNFWKNVETGLFTDIYELIDEDPNTSRDDFSLRRLRVLRWTAGYTHFPLGLVFNM